MGSHLQQSIEGCINMLRTLKLLCTCGVLSLFSSIAISAKIKPVSIQEVTAINFGTLAADNGICTMQSGGVLVASAGQSCSGIQTPAEFKVNASNGEVLIASVTGGNTQGITFRPQIDGSEIITVKGSSVDIFIIGELEFNNVSQGVYAIPYIVTVNYQ